MSEESHSFAEFRATYRLQLSGSFDFREAAAVVPYLAALGISHVYASPITKARPGSEHGYDIIDHNRLNPELGGEEGFHVFADALRRHGMGLLVDFVPNHMGIGVDNAWWRDVLEWGKASPFAPFFDINWDAARPDLKGRVLLAVLGGQYGETLEKGEICLSFDAAAGSFAAGYFEHRFPISPPTYAVILEAGGELLRGLADKFATLAAAPVSVARDDAMALKRRLARAAREPAVATALATALRRFAGLPGEARSFDRLHRLLEAQHYRIADWHVAAEEINYRRFFNINDLAGLRMELPELFEHSHRLLLDLIRDGDVQGVRIDHIDGLFDPRTYCERLWRASAVPLYVVVEKILARYEMLPDWPVAGATGYEFTNQVLGLFVDPAGERWMTRLYRRLGGRDDTFDDVLYAAKLRIMRVNLASEMNVLAGEFHRLSMRERRSRDFTLNGMRAALEEAIAAFPVYRTYVSQRGASADDRRYIGWAIGQAKKRWRGADASIFDFLQAVLTGERETGREPSPGGALHAAMHLQQVTGPVMAKAAEDTAFYRYVRLLALNEVGGDPRRFGVSVSAFHHLTQERARLWPRAMVTTATHDTKRGEDARIRLALLSEAPREWGRRLGQWFRLNRSRRSDVDDEIVPSRNVEYLFYQSLLGAWPPALAPNDTKGVAGLAARLEEYMIKAVREAKQQTSWSNPNPAYETALRRFVQGVLDAGRTNPFLAEFHAFVTTLARPAAIASLAQLVLKLTVPGVPDIYQGGELWDFSLVDPDNRRPVDWDLPRTLLGRTAVTCAAGLAANWQNGCEKLFVTRHLLALRRANPALFADGDYQPLDIDGEKRGHLCAFARRWGDWVLVAAVPRLLYRLYRDDDRPDWGATQIVLPDAGPWRNWFTGCPYDGGDRVKAASLFADFPVAVLVGGTGYAAEAEIGHTAATAS
jgi:(1->4)-alpha-D-glucan 1-alpha-D-glucosylmutase